MRKCDKEIVQSQLDREKQLIKDLKYVFGQAQDDVVNKIIDLSRRKDMENLQTIIYQSQYQEVLMAQIDASLDLLQANEYSTIQEYLNDCYSDGYVGTMYQLAKTTGITIVAPIDQKSVTKAIEIDSKLSKTLYKSLDMSELKKSVRMEVSRGILNGSSWNDIGSSIGKSIKGSVFQKPLNNGIRIARTEGHRIQVASAMDAQRVAKDKGADIVKQWDATLDGATRDSHRELDGKIAEIDDDFEYSGGTVSAPGMFGDPAEDCNCRCALLTRARWALDKDELQTLKDRAAYFELDKTKDFEDFKEKYLNSQSNALKINLRFFAQDNKKNIYRKIANGDIDESRFHECYSHFKTCFKDGVKTPIGTVYDTKDRFYHIVDRHEYMMSEENIDRIINTLSKPKEIFESKDKFGSRAMCYIEDSVKNTLIVIDRNGIITSYEPDKKYLEKIRKGNMIWNSK